MTNNGGSKQSEIKSLFFKNHFLYHLNEFQIQVSNFV